MYLNDYFEKYGIPNFSLAGFDEKGIPHLAVDQDEKEWEVLEFCNYELIQILSSEISEGIKLIDAGYFATSPMGAKIQKKIG